MDTRQFFYGSLGIRLDIAGLSLYLEGSPGFLLKGGKGETIGGPGFQIASPFLLPTPPLACQAVVASPTVFLLPDPPLPVGEEGEPFFSAEVREDTREAKFTTSL